MWLLYVFIVSLVGVTFLFLAKRREIKKQRQSFIGRFLAKGDPAISKLNKRFQDVFHYRREKTFFFFLVHVPNRTESFFSKVKLKTHDHYLNVSAKMRGKRTLSQNSASPYLRSMTMRKGE